MPITIAACWGVTHRLKDIHDRDAGAGNADARGVLVALDMVLFYLFFEAGLIPMFLIIGIWGGKDRDLCRVQVLPLHLPRVRPMLVGMVAIYVEAGTTDIPSRA